MQILKIITFFKILALALLLNPPQLYSADGESPDTNWLKNAEAAVEAAVPKAEKDGTRPVYHLRPSPSRTLLGNEQTAIYLGTPGKGTKSPPIQRAAGHIDRRF